MRIGIANDLPEAVEALTRVVQRGGRHEVIWVARDSAEALTLSISNSPDVILIGVPLVGIDGVEATRRIMAVNPCAILITTPDISSNYARVFAALAAGAFDVVKNPAARGPQARKDAAALLAKMEATRTLVIAPRKPAPEYRAKSSFLGCPESLVLIGASAGGPPALATILGTLSEDFAAAIVIVQHAEEQAAPNLANWLNRQTALPVRLAAPGDLPRAGTALLSSGGQHLVFSSSRRLAYRLLPDHTYRPSIDVMFRSAARWWSGPLIGVLLTGMGVDGAEGLRCLRQAGHYTIAQDRLTSAVYGMPKAAAESGAAAESLPLNRIGPRLTQLVERHGRVHV